MNRRSDFEKVQRHGKGRGPEASAQTGALRDADLLLHSIVENLPHMVFVKDAAELRFVLFNRAGEDLLGYSRDQMIGKNDYDFFPKAEADFFTSKDREVLEGRMLVDIAEEPIHTRHKGTRLLHTKKIPILDAQSRPQFLLGISEDITEQKEAERRLRQTERLVSIGTLATGIAHEINNPIGAILLYAQTSLRVGDAQRERRKEALQEIVEQAERCGSIVQNVLQFARQESTQRWLHDVNNPVRHARILIEQEASERQATIELDLSDGLPQIRANATEFEQVMVNLLRNAIQSARGVGIRVQTTSSGERIRVVVADNGPGIANEHLAYVFDPFYTTRQGEGGTGLGLSIARGIVESHGGTIEVRSELGAGTTVILGLPCAAESPDIIP